MKKLILTMIAVFIVFTAIAQTDSLKVYFPFPLTANDSVAYSLISVNNKVQLAVTSVYEFHKDTTNITATNFMLGSFIATGNIYDVSGYLHLLKQTGSNGLQIRYTYTDEVGNLVTFATDKVCNALTIYCRYSPQRIWVKPGTKVTVSIVFSGTGTVLYDFSADCRKIR